MNNQGQILIQTLVVSALAVVFITVLVNLAIFNINTATLSLRNEQAFQIAEAGVEYYRWALAHTPNNYTLGQPNPFSLTYNDKDGNPIGTIAISYTAPSLGSTIVTVRSTGRLNSDQRAIRTIEARLGRQSLAKYAILTNDKLSLSTSTVVYGPVHSNDGIHFDGKAFNLVTSAKSDYDDPDHSGGNEFGVHTHVNDDGTGATNQAFRPKEAPPNPVQSRTDVFVAGRQFPIPAVDYQGLTADLAQIKSDSQANGLYFAPSGTFGYEVVLRTNDTFDVYKVTGLQPVPATCTNDQNEAGWGTWSISATTTVGNFAIPASNGLVFFEDHVWASGKADTARLTIASAKFPEDPNTYTSITVNDDLAYTNIDGQDVVGLVAQNNVNVGLYSRGVLRIDAALVAKNGRIGRFYYREPSGGGNQFCGSTALRTSITLSGIIATNKKYGFSWSCGANLCSGYITRNINYDPNLLYSPPPSFPAVTTDYDTLSWQEVRSHVPLP